MMRVGSSLKSFIFISACLLVGGVGATTTGQTPLGLQYAVSAAMGERSNEYHVAFTEDVWRTSTPTQGYVTNFYERGFEAVIGEHRFALEFAGLGQGAELFLDPVQSIQHGANRIEYRRGDLTEWYVNGPLGLQQGFTFAARPNSFPLDQQLTLALRVTGTLTPDVHRDDVGASLRDINGESVLEYSGLMAFDVRGRQLPARMAWNGQLITLTVDDSSAIYPVTVDPLLQQAYLKATDPGDGDRFGWSVAIDGDTAVIGAPGEKSDGSSEFDDSMIQSGAAYVFVRSGVSWSQQAFLKASIVDAGDGFGGAVAISGDTIVVGAVDESSDGSSESDESLSSSGAAYVFARVGDTWNQQAFLKASNPGLLDLFGTSLAIDGDTIVVGAPFERGDGTSELDDSAQEAGAAYVFTRNGSTWQQEAYLKASNAGELDRFGTSVSVSGNTVVVGAPRESGDGSDETDNSLNASGAAYVFVRSSGVWSQQAYLKASNPDVFDLFGEALAIDGDFLVVGAHREESDGSIETNNNLEFSGAAYVFERTGFEWAQVAYLKASNAGRSDSFGFSVDIDGPNLVVGAVAERSDGSSQADNSLSGPGAAYVFSRIDDRWLQVAYLKASNAGNFDRFGHSVAIDQGSVLIGAQGESGDGSSELSNLSPGSGAAYVFAVPTGTSSAVTRSDDDAEQVLKRRANLTSADLEIVPLKFSILGADRHLVGLRFDDLQIPPGQEIVYAYIQFTADETHLDDARARIRAQAVDDADPFTRRRNNISRRPLTGAQVAWDIASWRASRAGVPQRTPDLTPLVEEVVARPGWSSGNAMVFVIEGELGRRVAKSLDSGVESAPKLVVSYISDLPKVARPEINPGGGLFAVPVDVSLSSATPGATVYYTLDGGDPTMTDNACGCPILINADTTIKARAFADGFAPSDVASARIMFPSHPDEFEVLDLAITSSNDDAEQRGGGTVSLFSDDLEMVEGSGTQTVGLRFQNVTLPRYARVNYAYLLFHSEEASEGPALLTIEAERSGDAPKFRRRRFDISNRSVTGAQAFWNVPEWAADERSVAQLSPNLSEVIGSVVENEDWESGNAIALIVTGSGLRSAFSFNADPNKAPILHIEYQMPVP